MLGFFNVLVFAVLKIYWFFAVSIASAGSGSLLHSLILKRECVLLVVNRFTPEHLCDSCLAMWTS